MYVCMHRMRVPLRRTSVPMLELGAGRCSSNFLFSVCNWGFCLHLHSEMHICNCLWLFLAIHFLFIILECNLFIIICIVSIVFLLLLLSFCCFTSLYLFGLCSNVGHHFLQGMMLVAASLNRALLDLYNLKDHYNQE